MNLETMYSQIDGHVATIVLNRPEVLNCANEQWERDHRPRDRRRTGGR
jgi:enoyl-CoA hydratase/carnithine racemase